jgi:hypothetical protein
MSASLRNAATSLMCNVPASSLHHEQDGIEELALASSPG